MRQMLAVACLLTVGACGGGVGVPPTAPTASTPVTDPIVTIRLTYTCHPCTNDPDNYELNVQGGGYVRRLPGTTGETGTLVWNGPLAAGTHSVELRIDNA